MGLPLTFSDLDDFGWSPVTGFPIVRNSSRGSHLDEDYVRRLQNLDNHLRLFFGYYELDLGDGDASRRCTVFNYLDVFGSLEDVLAEGPDECAMDSRIRAAVARSLAMGQNIMDLELLNNTRFAVVDVDVQVFMLMFMIVQGLRMRREAQERPIGERLRKLDRLGRASSQAAAPVSAGTTSPRSSQALRAPVLSPVPAPVPPRVPVPVPPPRTRRQSAQHPLVRRPGPESGAVPRPTQPPPPVPGPTHCEPPRPPRRRPRSTMVQGAPEEAST